jgi:uncharacterized protein (TIGR02301 family)
VTRLIRTAAALALAAALMPAQPAAAQKILTVPPPSGPAAPAPAPAAPVAPGVPTAPPYDEGLLRLSEILGALHYLRELCGAGEAGLWRDQMQALIDSEQPDPDRRARFVDRFNRGYQAFRAVYLACTPAASLAIDRYVGEGRRIARDIAARYGKEK